MSNSNSQTNVSPQPPKQPFLKIANTITTFIKSVLFLLILAIVTLPLAVLTFLTKKDEDEPN